MRIVDLVAYETASSWLPYLCFTNSLQEIAADIISRRVMRKLDRCGMVIRKVDAELIAVMEEEAVKTCPLGGCQKKIEDWKFACHNCWHQLTGKEKTDIAEAFEQFKAGVLSAESFRRRQREVVKAHARRQVKPLKEQ